MNNPIQPWHTEADFLKVFNNMQTKSLVKDPGRCYMLYQLVKHTACIPGRLAEVGVFRGGTAYLIASVMDRSVPLHLFDTFTGMPKTDPEKDKHTEGNFSTTSLDNVKKFLAGFKNIVFHPGKFPETSLPIEDSAFSFVHIDVDIYQSTLDCCKFFYPRMIFGGVMVIDDYGFLSCPGAKMAVDEYFKDKQETVYLPTGQCMITKVRS